MQIDALTLTGFRSYEQLDVAFGPGPQLIVGANAAGKTNLLESIALLGTGHSHRTATDADLVRWTAPFARSHGRFGGSGAAGPAGHREVEVLLVRPTGAGAGVRKRILVNGIPRRGSALATVVRIVMFAPEEMQLVSGSPSARRAALDAMVVQRSPTAASSLSTYGRALQQRNGLLRQLREGLAARDELHYWDDVVVNEGARLVDERLALMEALAGPLAAAHAEIAPSEQSLSLRYLTNAPPLPGESSENALRRRLKETAEKELWNGSTLVGPHRDDIAFESGGRDLAPVASRGQQRSAILSFKLAQLDLLTALDGRPPLLLLDDVFSELDPDRRAHLVRRIGELPQAFVSTTTLQDLDPALVAASTAWRVAEGRLERVS